MATSDGAIILSVEIDKSSMKSALSQLKSTSGGMNTLNTATQTVTTSLKKFAGALGIAFSVVQIVKFSKEAGELASQTEAYLKRLTMLYGDASQSVYDFANANAHAFGMAKSQAYEALADYGNILSDTYSGKELAQLSNELLQMTAVIASQTGRTYDDVFEKIRSGLYGNTRAIDDLGLTVRQAGLMATSAWDTVTNGANRSTKVWNSLTDIQLQQLRVLGILENGYKKYGNTVMQSSALVRSQFNAAWTEFKATWGSVINGVLIPVLNVLTKIISAITVGLSWIAKFMGKSLELGKTTATISQDTGDMSDNIDDATSSQKKYNKEMKKTLAGFDELEILQSNDDSGSDTDTGVGGGVSTTTDVGGSRYEPDVSSWQSAIAGLVEVLVGVGFVALGIILCSMGHIALGVGAIAFGLLSIGVGLVTLGNAFDTSSAKELLLIVTGISGLLLLSIGVMLLYFGSKAWGIACIVGGVALLGYTAYELATGGMETEQIMSTLSTLLAFMGGALLAIGMFLIWIGGPVAKAWGIGCIIAGVASLVTAVATGTQGDLGIADWLTNLMVVAGGFLLVLGIMVLMTGFSPVGLGLVVAGVVVLGVALVNKSDAMSAETLAWINGIFAIVSAAALVIGIIMMCCGVISPLSIGLVVVGAVGLAAEIAINYDAIKNSVTKFLDDNAGLIVGIAIALVVIGIILCCCGILPLGIGLIVAGAVAIGSEIALHWDAIKNKVSEIINEIIDWIKTYGMLVLGIMLCLTGVGIPLGIKLIVDWCKDNYGEVEIATAIVDKVKEIWQKIKDFWDDNIKQIFTKEWWLELAKKCGNGLISGFESAVNGIIGLFEKMINFVVKGLNKISIDIPDWVPGVGGKTFGFDLDEVSLSRVSIPRLAQGAVIPANREFLAILGDQKKGTNIEAPAELIKQMAKEAYQEMGLANNQQQQIIKEEHYNLNQTELMTIMYKLVKGGERLNGTSLVKQGGI